MNRKKRHNYKTIIAFLLCIYLRGQSKIVFSTPLSYNGNIIYIGIIVHNKKKISYKKFRPLVIPWESSVIISRRSNPFDRWTMVNIDEGYSGNNNFFPTATALDSGPFLVHDVDITEHNRYINPNRFASPLTNCLN